MYCAGNPISKMSTAPPPPPPFPLEPGTPPLSPASKYENSSTFTYTDICKWASEHPQLWEAAAKYNICTNKSPYRHKYKHHDPILQVGPTCGLVALSMLIHGEVTPDEMLEITKTEGFTYNGEMFSCKNMLKLIEKVLNLIEITNVKYTLRNGGLFSDETIEDLLNGAALLVPYDADCNHSPSLRRGHTAHWALVCGVVIMDNPGDSYTSEPNNIYVFVRHGKSKYLAAWKLKDLCESNKNLWEFSPKKNTDGLLYMLPEGGIGGENGLRGQFLVIEGL